MSTAPETVGLVLAGGGARGAYEVGVLCGIIEALELRADEPAPFRVVAGTSVGAINGAWMISAAHRGDHAIHELRQVWQRLELAQHLRLDLKTLTGWMSPLRFLRGSRRRGHMAERFGRSLLDPSAIEALVTTSIDWPRLHQNLATARARALIVAALHVGTGVTTMFAELSPGTGFEAPRSRRQRARIGPLGVEHVLASAAIPALFPARLVGRSYFVDGGLRFNTPLAPAIRAGAERLVVITLRHDRPLGELEHDPDSTVEYPHPVFLAGKILNALLLDPVAHDLQILGRFNKMMSVLEATLTPAQRASIDELMVKQRGTAYRRIDTLAFEPSQDIGVLAGHHLRENLGEWKVGHFYEWLLAKAADADATWEADLASYILFDGAWAETLIELGRGDAARRRDEIRAFFSR